MELLIFGLEMILMTAIGVAIGVFLAGMISVLAMTTKKGAEWLMKRSMVMTRCLMKLMEDDGLI